MPSKRTQLVAGEIYHVVVRGVGDSLIFKDINDYYRGIFSIYELNNRNLVDIWLRRQQRKQEKALEALNSLEGRTLQAVEKRDLLVEIFAFCFMPNHVHILLKQSKDRGISNFMQKFGTGYATYFNKKYKRKGHLFNKFKAIRIESDNQLKNVFVYIHCNPISLIEPGFKEKGIKNPKEVANFLKTYKWSSYQDYLGIKNFDSVTSRDFFLEILGGEPGVKQAMDNWITHKNNLHDFEDIVLE